MPLLNPRLIESQSWLELSQNNIFHVSTSNPSYSEILSTLTKFDPRLTPRSTENPNFDPSVTTGWG